MKWISLSAILQNTWTTNTGTSKDASQQEASIPSLSAMCLNSLHRCHEQITIIILRVWVMTPCHLASGWQCTGTCSPQLPGWSAQDEVSVRLYKQVINKVVTQTWGRHWSPVWYNRDDVYSETPLLSAMIVFFSYRRETEMRMKSTPI
jgi:hypothetical protein